MSRFAQKYLPVYNIFFSLEVLIGLSLAIASLITGVSRISLGEPADAIIFLALFGLHIGFMLGNVLFVLIEGLCLRRQHGSLSIRQQLMLLGSLLPWIGIAIHRSLWKPYPHLNGL